MLPAGTTGPSRVRRCCFRPRAHYPSPTLADNAIGGVPQQRLTFNGNAVVFEIPHHELRPPGLDRGGFFMSGISKASRALTCRHPAHLARAPSSRLMPANRVRWVFCFRTRLAVGAEISVQRDFAAAL